MFNFTKFVGKFFNGHSRVSYIVGIQDIISNIDDVEFTVTEIIHTEGDNSLKFRGGDSMTIKSGGFTITAMAMNKIELSDDD